MRQVSSFVSLYVWQAQMERGLASVFKLAGTFCKHFGAQAAFLRWALPSPPIQKSIHTNIVTFNRKGLLPESSAVIAGHAQNCWEIKSLLRKKTENSHLQEPQWESYPHLLGQRHEKWNWNTPTTQIQGFTWWIQIQSHGPYFRLYSPQAFPRNMSFFSFVCFLQTWELGGSLGITGCYQSKERKLLPF